MKLLQPVIWSKGTFLQPQHLQAQDRFLESLIEFRTRELCFKPYGFASLAIDSERLAADGVFQLVEAKGLMPDGLTLDMPACDPLIEPRLLNPGIFDGLEAVYLITVENDKSDKPCCVAEWVVRYYW